MTIVLGNCPKCGRAFGEGDRTPVALEALDTSPEFKHDRAWVVVHVGFGAVPYADLIWCWACLRETGQAGETLPVAQGVSDYAPPPLVQQCGVCAALWRKDGWALAHSFASVGIEYGKSSYEMAELFFEDYHQNGHRQERV